MPRTSLSEGELAAFRSRVIDAATALFAGTGYDGVTMRAIANEVGCSPMTPYRYFRDKDEIFAEVAAAAYRRFANAQADSITNIEDPGEKLTALGIAYVRFALIEPDAYRVMFELTQSLPADHAELQAQAHRASMIMRDTVAAAVDAGVIQADPETAFHILWAGLHGVISLHLAGKLQFGRTVDELIPAMMMNARAGLSGHNEDDSE